MARGVTLLALLVLAGCGGSDGPQRGEVEVVATGLEVPWEIAFLPDGSALVTERPGRVRLLGADGKLRRGAGRDGRRQRAGGGRAARARARPRVRRQAAFAYVYVTPQRRHEAPAPALRATASSTDEKVAPSTGIEAGAVHDSGRLRFGPDKQLYLATGDAGQGELAQDDGLAQRQVPGLTPEQYRATARPTRRSSPGSPQPAGLRLAAGHRPAERERARPQRGSTVHGGYDEINPIVPGRATTAGRDSSELDRRLRRPAHVYGESIAPSGATFVTPARLGVEGRLPGRGRSR